MKRAAVPSILIAVVLLALGVIAQAQQPKKVPRIGFMIGTSPSIIPDRIEGFRQGLRELGYVEGKTLLLSIEWPRGK
jgi:putative tryptophan/tyrosine transport system substrate-binding protein